MAHHLEESFWRHLEQLERQVLQRGDPPAIDWRPVARPNFEWTEVFAHFVAPSASTQRAALLGHAVQQASTYVARLLVSWVPDVNTISETTRRSMVEAMTVLRMDAHGSAGFREQASALHGSGGSMDYGHANAHMAYTEGLRILNPAFEQLRNADPSGNFQRIQQTLGYAPPPPNHRSESRSGTFDHGYAHVGAGGQHPFSLPPGHYQSLGRHHHHQAQDRASVYWPVSRASRASAMTNEAAGGDATDAQGA
ncbi:hypothetical protein BCR35DRAFT_306113 [Leucosporidium creatinivorum]|uniref:Uncharacterized protein n=1 Tax=Leucosporidium creatinivorum TaxID=106004 RepID=A0A1Y2EVK9_9BASI|nr:hypothetical protein BCR35DRAFT_306113 [Leucosporidium creatinivorum]